MPSKRDAPTYYSMIRSALIKLNERYGSKNKLLSAQAINAYIGENFDVPKVYKGYIKRALKKAVKDENLIQVRRSYKFTSSELPSSKRRKSPRNTKRTGVITRSQSRRKSPRLHSTEISYDSSDSELEDDYEDEEIEQSPRSKRRTTRNSLKKETKTSSKERKTIKESTTRTKKTRKVANKQKIAREKIISSRRNNTTNSDASVSIATTAPILSTPLFTNVSIATPILSTPIFVATTTTRTSNTKTASKEALATLSKNSVKNPFLWQYNFEGNWKDYDYKASDTVESVYQGYLANRGDTDVRAVKSGQYEYMVDFMAMKQTNLVHPNHTIRDIRRIPVTFV